MNATLVLVIALAATGAGCRHDPAMGHERGTCRPDQTCEVGLICLSNLCVRPPPANCQDVAEQLTSIELGNYAEPEARAPVVARYRAACDGTMVSRDEQQCVDKARDRWAAAQCVPRLFPEMASSSAADCPAVVDKIRAATRKQLANQQDPTFARWSDSVFAVMRESCEQDRWPDVLKKCVLASDDIPSITATCNPQTPPSLQRKLQERLQKALQDLVH